MTAHLVGVLSLPCDAKNHGNFQDKSMDSGTRAHISWYHNKVQTTLIYAQQSNHVNIKVEEWWMNQDQMNGRNISISTTWLSMDIKGSWTRVYSEIESRYWSIIVLLDLGSKVMSSTPVVYIVSLEAKCSKWLVFKSLASQLLIFILSEN